MRFAKRAGAIICTIILAVTFCFGTTTAAAATQSEKSMNIRAINNDLPVPFSLNDYQVTQYKGSYNFVEKSGGYYYMLFFPLVLTGQITETLLFPWG